MSTTPTTDCGDCDKSYTDTSYSLGTLEGGENCSLFAVSADFVTQWETQYDAIGVSTDPDILYDGPEGWVAIDGTPSATRTRTSHDDADNVKVSFEFTSTF